MQSAIVDRVCVCVQNWGLSVQLTTRWGNWTTLISPTTATTSSSSKAFSNCRRSATWSHSPLITLVITVVMVTYYVDYRHRRTIVVNGNACYLLYFSFLWRLSANALDTFHMKCFWRFPWRANMRVKRGRPTFQCWMCQEFDSFAGPIRARPGSVFLIRDYVQNRTNTSCFKNAI